MESQSIDGRLAGPSGPSAYICQEQSEFPHTQAPLTKQASKLPRQRAVKCNVIGCRHNLVKAYDKKARTCSFHRKESRVELEGIFHRFCQQCSRFHPLAEFDGERKNCRQRLQQHNRRQRRMRLLRRPDGQDDHDEEFYQIQQEPEAHRKSTRVPATAEPQLIAPESPDLSEAAAGDGMLLSSVDIDSLLGPYSANGDCETSQQIIDERLLQEISSTVLTAVDATNLLMAEDVWNDQWFKPALGNPTEMVPSPYLYGAIGAGDAPRFGGDFY